MTSLRARRRRLRFRAGAAGINPAARRTERQRWGREYPRGPLVEVRGPGARLEGKKAVSAGRRADGHGRSRLYEVGVDGRGLRPLTGGPDAPGCAAAPPLRFRSAADRTPLPEGERRGVD